MSIVTNGIGKPYSGHLNLTGRTMADVWRLPPARYDRKKRYVLKNADGRYLRAEGGLTAEKRNAWVGNGPALRKLRRVDKATKGMRAERVA